MPKYPAAVWGTLWIKHGGRRDKVAEAVATVMCESGGDTDATSPMGARGGWQFMPGTLPSDQCARDPNCSTREAVKLSNRGADFSAWDCHPDSEARSGRGTGDEHWENILADIKTPLGDIGLWGPDIDFTNPLGPLSPINPGDIGVPGDIAKGGISNPLGGINDIAAFARGLGELILTPEGWLRLAKMIGGSILLLWGLRIVIRESTGSDPVSAAKDVGEVVAGAAIAKKLPI